MIKDAIEKILELATAQQLTIDGREYTDKKIYPVTPPVQAEISVMTLTAIADYFKADPDGVLPANAKKGFADKESAVVPLVHVATPIVHVVAYNCVRVVSAIADEWRQRHHYIEAKADGKLFRFGSFLPIEEFNIALQSYFMQDETTAALLKITGNLTDETSIKYHDDGVTQQVQAKTGIARVGTVDLPNPVILCPYRTFLEVPQPASRFVFRLKRSENSPPQAALFEADGGNWQLEAVQSIKGWLTENLPSGTVILA